MQFKEFDSRFIPDDTQELRVGINVGRHNLMPVCRGDFGYIEKIKDESLGFKYGVREMDSGKLYWHHSSTIRPILPILISKDDNINKGDFFYVDNGEVHECADKTKETSKKLGRVINTEGKDFLTKWVNKVVARPHQIGLCYNYGPPHDHNHEWKNDSDGIRYLEDYIPTCLHEAVWKGCKMLVRVQEVCPHYDGKHLDKDCSCKSGFVYMPLLHDGKVVMDTYGYIKENPIGSIIV